MTSKGRGAKKQVADDGEEDPVGATKLQQQPSPSTGKTFTSPYMIFFLI